MFVNPNSGLGMGSSLPEPKIGNPNFPTTPGLPANHYPDVTSQFNDVKDDMYGKIFNAQHPQVGSPKSVNGMMQDNFQPQGAWDLTSKSGFPGTNNQGQTEYGQFKGGTVTGEFLNNHLFGMGMAASGQYPQSGLSDNDPTYGQPYPQAQIPQGINHSEAIASGYKSYHGDDSWQQQPIHSLTDTPAPAPDPTPAPDPNAPVILQGRVDKTSGSPPDQPGPSAPPESDNDGGWSWPDSPFPIPSTHIWRNAPLPSPVQTLPQQQVMAPVQPVTPVFQPQPYVTVPQQQPYHPMIAAYPTARMDYGGVPVHPVHADEMSQVDQVYTQNAHPALNPVEISQWPKTRQFHQARAQQIQQQAQASSWHPSQSQIQRRDFQMPSRGGFDNHPNAAIPVITSQRQLAEEKYIRKTYQLDQGKKLNWYQFADIVDHIARQTNKEEDFRQDLWHHFGSGNQHNLLQYVDVNNPGLPQKYKNIDPKGNQIYEHSIDPKRPWNPGEQVHHYLGGVTGDMGESNWLHIPSHHLNALTFGNFYPAA